MSQVRTDSRPVVILAEDEPLVRMFLSELLDDAGYKVFEVGHADDALLLLQARPDVQVLVTDVEMDGGSMDGFALARQARECWPHLGIVVVSGRAAPAPGDLPEGALFIAKPYRATAMFSTLQAMAGPGTPP